jgi:hypothetical protein
VSYARACHDQLKKHKTATVIKEVEFQGSDFDYEINVPFLEMHHLIVIVRNRMFHFRQGESNLILGEIGGSEVICKMIMNEAIHWFSKIYSEILRTLIKTST